MRKNRMNRNLRGGFRLREDGTFANPAMERLSRSGFLKAVGAGAAAIGAASFAGAGTVMAQTPAEQLPVPCGEIVYNLIAGQHHNVGTVTVGNDETNLYVTYELNEVAISYGWCLAETHVHVAGSMEEIPQKNGNPPPGQFDYHSKHDYEPCVTEYTETIPLSQDIINILEEECGDEQWDLIVAAHAVIKKIDCEVTHTAPYPAFQIVDWNQGLKKDGGAVNAGRSDPNAVLTWNNTNPPNETDFFSLGFGGWIVLEFDCCISNGNAPHLLVVEDTWGSGYPLESADVYGSSDGVTWTPLGEARNDYGVGYPVPSWQTVSEFDLSGHDCIKYIKIVDTSPPELHNSSGDGFDLNTVLALNNCEECTTKTETAWGQGPGFPGKNWAMYMEYDLQCCDEIVTYPETGEAYIGYEDWPNGDFDYNDFGMYFRATETYQIVGNEHQLKEVVMTFKAMVFDSGGWHWAHITRPINGDSTVTVTRGIYGAPIKYKGPTNTANETPAGSYTNAGDVTVVLFDTEKYKWNSTNNPAKNIEEEVVVKIEVLDPSQNIKSPPEGWTRWDVDEFMANYDTWLLNTKVIPSIPNYYGSEWHVNQWQYVDHLSGGGGRLDQRLRYLSLPHVLVIPSPNWIPPYEDTCISGPLPYGPYQHFFEYYSSLGTEYNGSSPLKPWWYEVITYGTVGYGGLSW